LTRQSVADVLQTALQAEVVSYALLGQQRFDLLVRLEKQCQTTVEEWRWIHLASDQVTVKYDPSEGFAELRLRQVP